MAIPSLSDEQIRTWSRQQKDRWWFQNVWRGDMPQLTIRSGITGFLLGGILSATNLYVGAKTGWTLGVGLTSVLLAFIAFRVMARAGLAKDFTILENNAMQSIATAAGYMTGPLISSLGAYMVVQNATIPWVQIIGWNVILSILGVLVAFPMKRRFINDEQQPFPEGRAAGVVLDALYTTEAATGVFKAKALLYSGLLAAAIQFTISEGYHQFLQVKLLGLRHAIFLRDQLHEYYYAWAARNGGWMPTLGGVDVRQLGFAISLDLSMIGAGGLMGTRIANSLMIGAILNFVILAPWMISRGDIPPRNALTLPPVVQVERNPAVAAQAEKIVATAEEEYAKKLAAWESARAAQTGGATGGASGDEGATSTAERAVAAPPPEPQWIETNGGWRVPARVQQADGTIVAATPSYGRGQILNTWSLWWGISAMVVASLTALFAKPKVLIDAFRGLTGRRPQGEDVLRGIELPLSLSFIGVPLLTIVAAWMGHAWFGVVWWHSILAIPLILVLTLIAANATALTSITPSSSLAKITQFTFGGLDRATLPPGGVPNASANLMTAGMTSEIALNASNLLMDIKPGYMLGAKPRQQAVGHCIGILAGAIASTPLFFLLFLSDFDPATANEPGRSLGEVMQTQDFSFPGVTIWKGVSDLITSGGANLPHSAVVAMLIAGAAAMVMELVRIGSKGRFPISPLAIGLGVVIPPDSTLMMWLGALFFATMGRLYRKPGTKGHMLWVETHEPLCAGLIAGAALTGIGAKLVEVFSG
jgi:uncharacterized oligopeptide transporter (OPT) family protein